jgi:hypothetical protein
VASAPFPQPPLSHRGQVCVGDKFALGTSLRWGQVCVTDKFAFGGFSFAGSVLFNGLSLAGFSSAGSVLFNGSSLARFHARGIGLRERGSRTGQSGRGSVDEGLHAGGFRLRRQADRCWPAWLHAQQRAADATLAGRNTLSLAEGGSVSQVHDLQPRLQVLENFSRAASVLLRRAVEHGPNRVEDSHRVADRRAPAASLQ